LAQNYASSYLKELDERFFTESKTGLIVNKGIRLDFNGKNSVTIYNVDVVAETDYVRSGSNRFGALVELGTGVQTFTLSQDKAFTFTVDRGNLEDSMMAQEAAKAVKRQVREVSVPTTDIYTLSVLAAYAVANSQVATNALAYTDIYQKILIQNAALTDAEVPEEGRILFINATNYNLLKRDPEFMKACDTTVRDLKKGVVGEVDGLKIVVCPASYYIANFGFMIVHESVAVRPVKFNSVRVLDEVQGIDGWVAEGRRYYDVFIPTNKGVAVRLHKIA
jgi:hypothetical protein